MYKEHALRLLECIQGNLDLIFSEWMKKLDSEDAVKFTIAYQNIRDNLKTMKGALNGKR